MSFELRKIYKFSTRVPTILGEEHTGMKVKSILTAEEAVKYRDIETLHTTMKTIISDLPLSTTDCTYVLFEKSVSDPTNQCDNEKVLLAIEYITLSSIEEITTMGMTIVIDDISSDMVAVISSRLRELGITNARISTHMS